MTEPLPSEEEVDRPKLASSGPVRVRVPAKINLYLGVGPRRPDGYHELTTVYHAIALHDEVTARRGDRLTLTMEGEGAGDLALDDSNLALRAARALAEHAGRPAHARLHLRKQIPLAAGLAGGSADAAATLVACDALWGLGLGRGELAAVAARIGSDVPFLVYGGTALGTGRGEAISPVLARATTWYWVVALARTGLSTPDVYAELDRMRAAGAVPLPPAVGAFGRADDLLAALRQRDPEVLAGALHNDLQPAALSLRPAIADTLRAGADAGALAGFVSGSGPTCVFLARDQGHAAVLGEALQAAGACRAAQVAPGPVAGARLA